LRGHLERALGRLDVLINNAGMFSKSDGAGLVVGLDTVRTTLETNTLAPLQLAQTLAPLLKRGSNPRIINVSSGMRALSDMEGGYAAYRISKAALNAVTAILAAGLPSTRFVRAGSRPTWAAPMPSVRFRKEQPASSGWRSTPPRT
jgi:NAD(P)-dependent dehydrogenase (short-subunit alcohol dehydrogenase family)